MAVSPEFREYALEQLGRVAPVSARSMFGGVGVYGGGLFFALLDDDRLYLKVDDANRAEFEAIGSRPFQPFGEGSKPMGYYELPGDLLEDVGRLRPWVEVAIEVARRAAGRKGKRG